MTKTTTKATAAKAVKSAPIQAKTPVDSASDATQDVATIEIPAAEVTQIVTLNYAQALSLPEVPADAKTLPSGLSGDSVQAFKGNDRRTMRVVRTKDGLAAQAAD